MLVKQAACVLVVAAFTTVLVRDANSQSHIAAKATAFLGFDRNDYPGDQNLKLLRQKFSYTGFWLNPPPGAKTTTWLGKRRTLQSAGFGFLVLFNGRLFNELNSVSYASKLGKSDAQAAVASARREGFPAEAIIFLDQEQGGRMLPEQKAYIYAWVDGVTAADRFLAGVYCSGISAQKEGGENIVTADDIRESAGGRKIAYWVTNDACPPSPGCVFPKGPPSPSDSGIRFADVWQFAQSPKRPDVAANCPGYNVDRNCYPPASDVGKHLHIDVNTATTADPSNGRSR